MTSDQPLRIVIADDQAIVREGLVQLLGGLSGIEVAGAAADGEQALALVAEHHPDAILLDLHMPVLDGIGATRRLAAEHPGVAIVVLTTYADDGSVIEALQAGARSYLTKDADRTEIATALRAAAGGLTVFDPRVHATLIAATSAPCGHCRPSVCRPSYGRPPARRPAGRTDPSRGRDPGPDCPRPEQSGNRRAPVPQQPHGEDAHQPHLRQDRLARPSSRHRLRPDPQHHLTPVSFMIAAFWLRFSGIKGPRSWPDRGSVGINRAISDGLAASGARCVGMPPCPPGSTATGGRNGAKSLANAKRVGL